MNKHEEERPPFNERAALEQLEQFKNDIERYRQQRKAVGEEFEHFVKSFKATPSPAPQTQSPATARPAASRPPEPPRTERPPVDPPARVSAPAPASAPPQTYTKPPGAAPAPEARVEPLAAAATPSAAERMPVEPARAKGGRPSPVVMLALLLLVAGLAAWYFWPQATNESLDPAATVTAPPPQTTAPPTAEPAAPQAPAPAAPSTETVVTTAERVWLRVIADGVKVREDEVPAGTRIPVDVQKTLVIRTGNAAAVSLMLKGKDLGALGAEGQVVTRSFTVPEK